MVQDRLVTICWESAILLDFRFVLFFFFFFFFFSCHLNCLWSFPVWCLGQISDQCVSSKLCKDSEFGYTSCMTEMAVESYIKVNEKAKI